MSQLDHTYAVILAGGSGTRFWPKSRQKHPKQLCHIGDATQTMIEKTLERIDGLIPPERRIIVTHHEQLAATREVVGSRCKYFIAEPEARNTAAALAVAAFDITKIHTGKQPPVMVSLHADHIIRDAESFRNDLRTAVRLAEQSYLTLIGIKPSFPSTGFGYIERGAAIDTGYKVASFREKPQLEIAQQYLASGKFYWNSGYFIWRADTILEELTQHLNKTFTALRDLQTRSNKLFSEMSLSELQPTYASLEKIAIDNAVLEVSSHVAVIPAHFDWHDVGSWDALDSCIDGDEQGNRLIGDIMAIDCNNITVDAKDKFVACIGVSDLIVVQTADSILVCPKSRAQDVKLIVEKLQANKRPELI